MSLSSVLTVTKMHFASEHDDDPLKSQHRNSRTQNTPTTPTILAFLVISTTKHYPEKMEKPRIPSYPLDDTPLSPHKKLVPLLTGDSDISSTP